MACGGHQVTVTNDQHQITVRGGTCIDVATVGRQGPAGPAGSTGVGASTAGSLSVLAQAGEALGGQRAVILSGGQAFHASSATLAHEGRVYGVTSGAAVTGADVTIVIAGDITESTWSWVPGPIYLGTNGLMTQIPPTTGFLQEIGTAKSQTVMKVALKQSIFL